LGGTPPKKYIQITPPTPPVWFGRCTNTNQKTCGWGVWVGPPPPPHKSPPFFCFLFPLCICDAIVRKSSTNDVFPLVCLVCFNGSGTKGHGRYVGVSVFSFSLCFCVWCSLPYHVFFSAFFDDHPGLNYNRIEAEHVILYPPRLRS